MCHLSRAVRRGCLDVGASESHGPRPQNGASQRRGGQPPPRLLHRQSNTNHILDPGNNREFRREFGQKQVPEKSNKNSKRQNKGTRGRVLSKKAKIPTKQAPCQVYGKNEFKLSGKQLGARTQSISAPERPQRPQTQQRGHRSDQDTT